MKRRSWSTMQRVQLFKKYGGVCHLCEREIAAGEAWDVSHEIPLALGGADDDENAKPAHRKCHKVITAARDVPTIAKAKRVEARHLGAEAPGRPIRSATFPIGKRRLEHPTRMPGRRPMFAGEAADGA